MAILQVQANGNAPAEAKAGDHIVTAGGTYQVLDSNVYSKMSEEQLASAGVGYNPSSGLYSRKVSDINTGTMATRDKNFATQWRDSANQKAAADLDSAYYTNRQNAYNTYNNSMTEYTQQMNSVKQDYLNNLVGLYDDTYHNNAVALERASNRGLTSSGLGNAMQVSALANAAKQNANLRADRNTKLNDIDANMIRLTNDYNVNLDTLVAKLASDKISALSQNEMAYLEAVMDMDSEDTKYYNSMLATLQQQAYEAAQSQIQREYQSDEAQKDRDFQLLLQQLGSSGYGYGGGGGYSRGGYSRGGYGGYSYGSSDVEYGDMTPAEYYAAVALTGNYGNLTEAEQAAIRENGLSGVTPYAVSSISSAKARQRGDKPVASDATKAAVNNKKNNGSSSSSSKNNSGSSTSTKHTGGGAGTSFGNDTNTKKEQKKKVKNSKIKKKGSAGGAF